MTEVPMPDEDTNIAHLSAERLASYIDGNLTPAEHNAALAHFDDCADCRREMTDARRVIALAPPARVGTCASPDGLAARASLGRRSARGGGRLRRRPDCAAQQEWP